MDQVAIFILLPMNKTERQLPLGLSTASLLSAPSHHFSPRFYSPHLYSARLYSHCLYSHCLYSHCLYHTCFLRICFYSHLRHSHPFNFELGCTLRRGM